MVTKVSMSLRCHEHYAGYGPGVPDAMMVAGYGMPGQPAGSPYVSGVGMPMWGQRSQGHPSDSLALPTCLMVALPVSRATPFVTVPSGYSRTCDHMLIDVEHAPGLSLPKPVRYVELQGNSSCVLNPAS